MPRIRLLKDSEIKSFNSPPHFSEDDRQNFFILEDFEDINEKFRKPLTKIGFILLRGYFLAKKMFLLPYLFYELDIRFVCELVGESYALIDLKKYRESTCRSHQKNILERYGYTSFKNFRLLFKKEASELVRTTLRPREIFYTLLRLLEERKIEVPTYYVFAETITESLNSFEKNLSIIVNKELTAQQKEILDDLISMAAVENEVSAHNPYLITKLKKPIQATTPRKIQQSLSDFEVIAELHKEFSTVLDALEISNELLNYYAVWVIKAKHIQFDSISDITKKYLYLIAFIVYQYRVRQDLFIDTFLQAIKKYENETKNTVAFNLLNQKPAKNQQVKQIKEMVHSSKEQLDLVKEIIYSSNGDKEKILLLRNMFSATNESFHDEVIAKLNNLEGTGTAELKDQMYFPQLSQGFRRINNRVAGILQVVKFNSTTSDSGLIEAISYFQKSKAKIDHNAPKRFIKNEELKWVYPKKGEFNHQLYKILLFRAVASGIKAGTLNLKYSDKYKSLDEYLIDSNRWQRERKYLLERTNLSHLGDRDIFLKKLGDKMHRQYEDTNLNIAQNEHLKFTKEGKPLVVTPKLEAFERDNEIDIFGKGEYLPLIRILSDIRYATEFNSSFVHYSRKNSEKTLSEESLYAAIIALGCNVGVQKMGKISKGIGPDKLEHTVRWYFSAENIDEANGKIIALTNELALSKIFQKDKNKLHTSSDGQKFNVSVPSLHATYSFKYFGSGKGVSAYSFIDEQSRLFYNTVISASEREAAYVIDGLMHNEEIESSIHSTDTHGYTEIIFGVCNALGIFFAPRIKNYKDQLLYTYKEKSRKYYEAKGFQILPSKGLYIDEVALKEHWEDILRLVCSIKLRETTASRVFKRLSSYSKQHPLYKALKEFGRIYKTIFILQYLDQTQLRQNIEKQLNRIEQSHQFARAVFFGNNQEFKFQTKEEQQVVVSCRHLIQNAIVLWNYLNISSKLTKVENREEYDKIINILKNSSIMSWQHINIHGEYDFEEIKRNRTDFDMEKIMNLNIN